MRLVTRGDFDGLTCAVLITQMQEIGEILLVHAQDIVERSIAIDSSDILANLPYHPECGMWFDHHAHTTSPPPPPEGFVGSFGRAPSAAGLVYEFYGGDEVLPQFAELVHETDRVDSADLTVEDVLDPQGFVLVGFTLDGRTGLGAYEDYFHHLVALLSRNPDPESVLSDPKVKRRCEIMKELDTEFRAETRAHSRMEGKIVMTDLRRLDHVPVGNRFLIYALYPDANVSVRIQWGPRREFQVMTLGHSITNRTCRTNLGELAARHGGGGHPGAASIPLMGEPDQQIQLILAELKANG